MSFGLGLASTADIYGPSAGATFFQAQEKAPSTASAIQSSPGSAGSGEAAEIHQVNLMPGLSNVNPLLWLPIILGAIVLLKLFREWGTKREEFSALKIDLYWFLMTTLAACAGIPLAKGLLNKYKIPGLTEWVNNA